MDSYCDFCKTRFRVELSVERDGDLHETYFTCPSCDHRYVCFVTDSTVRMLQTRLKGLPDDEFVRLRSDINKRMRTLKFKRITLHEFRRLKDETDR